MSNELSPLDRPTIDLRAKIRVAAVVVVPGPPPVSDEYWPSRVKFAFSPPPRSSEPFMPQRFVVCEPSDMYVWVPLVVGVSTTLLWFRMPVSMVPYSVTLD